MLLQNKIWSNFMLKARIVLLKQQQCGNTASVCKTVPSQIRFLCASVAKIAEIQRKWQITHEK